MNFKKNKKLKLVADFATRVLSQSLNHAIKLMKIG